MIVFRNYDGRFPFLWESADQPSARWHAHGDGPVQYFADTPNGAWAEFVRHEEIVELDDLAGVHRAICAVEIDPLECDEVALSLGVLTGDETSYPSCRVEATAMRSAGSVGLAAPSAALRPGAAAGMHVDHGLREAARATDGSTCCSDVVPISWGGGSRPTLVPPSRSSTR